MAVLGALIAYSGALLLTPPRTLLIVDESAYVSQALHFAGRLSADPVVVFPAADSRPLSDYPPGTSMLQAPLAWVFGWRGAVWASAISLVVATLIVTRLLRDMGLNPAFAILLPGFLGSLFFGRVGMSDMPSCALVAVSVWALWRARERDARWSFLAAFAAGLTLLFREATVVVLAPLLLGAVLRRALHLPAAIAGGVLGVGARLAAAAVVFGDPLFMRAVEYGFSFSGLVANLPQYVIILGVLFPAGLALPFFYRGERRAELVAGVAAYVTLYLLYEYNSARENGLAKGLVLNTRFMLEAVPILVVMAADVFPRWHAALRPALQRIASMGSLAYAAGVVAVAFGIHFGVRTLEAEPSAIVAAIQSHTSENAMVVTNAKATLKYLSPAYGRRRLIVRDRISGSDVPALGRRFGPLTVALLDRSDSEMFREDAAQNARFLSELRPRCTLRATYDEKHGNSLWLRVFEVTRCD